MNKKWISYLFAKLQARYGIKWISSIEGIEDLAVEEWSLGLSGLSGEEIRHGLTEYQGNWPPSLPEFKNACLGNQDKKIKEISSKIRGIIEGGRVDYAELGDPLAEKIIKNMGGKSKMRKLLIREVDKYMREFTHLYRDFVNNPQELINASNPTG